MRIAFFAATVTAAVAVVAPSFAQQQQKCRIEHNQQICEPSNPYDRPNLGYPVPPEPVPQRPPLRPQQPKTDPTQPAVPRVHLRIADADPNGFLSGRSKDGYLPPGHVLFKGNVVISNTKQIDHRWELEQITVTILNIHDGGALVTGPIERLGPKDFFVRAGGTVVRATKGFITPGQDKFHVTVLYDREGRAYPHDIWITLDGNIQQPQNNSPRRVGSVPPTTNNGPDTECTNIATCCGDLQRQYDEAIAP